MIENADTSALSRNGGVAKVTPLVLIFLHYG